VVITSGMTGMLGGVVAGTGAGAGAGTSCDMQTTFEYNVRRSQVISIYSTVL
jgi:hypothetical protein